MNIKNKLKDLANKQEINDLHENIISKVDTSKVLDDPLIIPTKRFRLFPLILGAASFVMVFAIGLAIPFMVNGVNTKPAQTNNPPEPVVTNPRAFQKSWATRRLP